MNLRQAGGPSEQSSEALSDMILEVWNAPRDRMSGAHRADDNAASSVSGTDVWAATSLVVVILALFVSPWLLLVAVVLAVLGLQSEPPRVPWHAGWLLSRGAVLMCVLALVGLVVVPAVTAIG